MENDITISSLRKIIITEWISIITVVAGLIVYFSVQIHNQTCRTDRLYEIWVETQKEIKQLYIDRK